MHLDILAGQQQQRLSLLHFRVLMRLTVVWLILHDLGARLDCLGANFTGAWLNWRGACQSSFVLLQSSRTAQDHA